MQKYIHNVSIFLQILLFMSVGGLDYGKQKYNTNTDFLLHEGNPNPNQPNRDYKAPQAGNNGNTQTLNFNEFPPLRTSTTTSITQTAKNDFPPLKSPFQTSPQPNNVHAGPSGKRDYVAPQFPTPTTKSTTKKFHSPPNTVPAGSSGKRDYVASQTPTLTPGTTVSTSGKVKDLINFYDSKGKGQNTPQKAPSYSSILQGSTGDKNPVSSFSTNAMEPVTPPTRTTSYTPKPLSFSSVVSGSKPTNAATTAKPYNIRPGNPVLPSSIVSNNSNKGNQASNQNGPSDSVLQIMSEELLRKDTNNAAKYITVNYQGKTTSGSKEDKAPGPLLTLKTDVWSIPTVEKFVPLLDNYERDTLINEYVTPQEKNEENAFMDAIMSTSVIRHLMNFLKENGYVTPDPKQQRDFLKQLWFSLYSRGKGKISSSGFEHVFVSELKNGEVSGLHNWIYFSKEESTNRVNYLGYLKYQEMNDKGVVMKLHFNQQGTDKPVDSMFIGTSPELEIALYTLCFVTRADNECKLKLGGKDVNIATHTFRYRSKNLIGSAFPQI
ncbi:endoribonuclease CG2145-like [Plodia interpunctella]|uniref:endoribonuclease CG2145-like n=1 Tax=Plodia interpunctella TaxID=58824 RepID=UPI0023682B2E|nr:endoribonuclease CG2145-like [Plodia interpunctella]